MVDSPEIYYVPDNLFTKAGGMRGLLSILSKSDKRKQLFKWDRAKGLKLSRATKSAGKELEHKQPHVFLEHEKQEPRKTTGKIPKRSASS